VITNRPQTQAAQAPRFVADGCDGCDCWELKGPKTPFTDERQSGLFDPETNVQHQFAVNSLKVGSVTKDEGGCGIYCEMNILFSVGLSKKETILARLKKIPKDPKAGACLVESCRIWSIGAPHYKGYCIHLA